MNVLGQVVYVIREEKSAVKEETVIVTSQVRIPASYSIGVTVTLFSLGTNEMILTCQQSESDRPEKMVICSESVFNCHYSSQIDYAAQKIC